MRIRIVMALVAASSVALMATGQEPQIARDDAYVSKHQPKGPAPTMDARIKDDPDGRREATMEQFGGEFTPEFMESLVTAANQQAAEYGPAGRGNIQVPAGGAWTNIGPR